MNWLINLYKTNAWFKGFVQAVEAGCFTGFVTATTNGFDFSKKGLIALGVGIGSGVMVAVRNYLVNRPNQAAFANGQKQ